MDDDLGFGGGVVGDRPVVGPERDDDVTGLDAEGVAQDAARAVASPDDSGETALAAGERLRLIRQVLDELPGRYGEMLELKYIEEWDVERIARRVGLSFEAAQSQLQRARLALRSAFEARGLNARDLLP